MLEIQGELNEFIDVLKNTQAYKEYHLQKEIMKEHPDLKKQIDEFRQKNYELQCKTYPDNIFDEMDRFQKQYEQFREIPMVHDFLAAELALCRMVQDVTGKIMESVSVDFE